MSTPSPETHVFVGMFRPQWRDPSGGYVCVCPRGHSRGAIAGGDPRTCWENGCYDTPVYKTIEEVVRMRRDEPVLLPERT